MKVRNIYPFILSVFLAMAVSAVFKPVAAQFVDVTFFVQTEEFAIEKERIWVEDDKDSSGISGKFVYGIQISARENVPVLVELELLDEPKDSEALIPEARWLNNGTPDYKKSKAFENHRALFTLDYRPRLINEFPGNLHRLTAWVFLIEEFVKGQVSSASKTKLNLKVTYL